jgi:hypothetical protein
MKSSRNFGIPIAITISCLAFGGAATGAPYVTYSGGAIIPHVSIVVVFWGSNVNGTVKSEIAPFLQTLSDSAYMDSLDEYYPSNYAGSAVGTGSLDPIGRGSLWGTVTITPTHTSNNLANTDVEAELATQIGAGVLPVPTANTLYMVYFPPGISINDDPNGSGSYSCTNWCGSHNSTTQIVSGQNVNFPYAMFPDCSGITTCGLSDFITDMMISSSHEMAEAITDPLQPSVGSYGWIPEIGDPCSPFNIGYAAYECFSDYRGFEYCAQQLYSDTLSGCTTGFGIPKCQQTSQAFGISPTTVGFAPAEVQQWFAGQCNTSPASGFPVNLCQNASDIYGIQPGNYGFAPTSVVNWFINNCRTTPLVTESNCQRAADAYGIVPYVTFGSAPLYVQQWWGQNSCNVAQNGLSACQTAANLYGIVPFVTFGFTPPDLQSLWGAYGCNSTSTATTRQVCQNASNMYGLSNQTWKIAPSNVVAWWNSNCSSLGVAPQCQGISNLLGTAAWVSWGIAPTPVQNWWTANGCNTVPQFGVGDVCQVVADNFGAANTTTEGIEYGFLQSNTYLPATTWWANNCQGAKEYHPRSHALRQYTIGLYGQ